MSERSKRDHADRYRERTTARLRRLFEAPSPLAGVDAATVEVRLRNMTYGHRTRD